MEYKNTKNGGSGSTNGRVRHRRRRRSKRSTVGGDTTNNINHHNQQRWRVVDEVKE